MESGAHAHSLKDLVPLSQLVHDSIMSCDVDVRASLLQNIVVVGNTSLTRGLIERLDLEIAALMPGVSRPIHLLQLIAIWILTGVAKDQDSYSHHTL